MTDPESGVDLTPRASTVQDAPRMGTGYIESDAMLAAIEAVDSDDPATHDRLAAIMDRLNRHELSKLHRAARLLTFACDQNKW